MSIASKYIKASLWAAAIRYVFLFLNFSGQIILARALIPEYFGTIALVLAIVGIVTVFVSFPINMGYIYLPDTPTLLSSSLILSILSWLALFLLSGIAFLPITHFYGSEIAIFVLLITFFKFFESVSTILLAQLEKKVDFKFSSLFAGLGGFLALALAVLAALYDFGIYSLVLREILAPVFIFILIRIYSDQKIDLKSYDISEMKALLRYSVKMLFSRGSEQLYVRVPFILIATYFDKNILGYISQMYYLSNLLNAALSTFNDKVAFVFFSEFKNEKKRAKKGLLYINLINLLLGIPVSAIFYLFPAEVLNLLWGDKWLAGAPYLQMLSLFVLFLPIFNSLKSYFYGQGKNEIVTFAYLGGLVSYTVFIFIWPVNIMLALAFTLSLILMLLFMLSIISHRSQNKPT